MESKNFNVILADALERYNRKTNADKIRTMTDEDLATIIAWPYIAPPEWCANHPTCPFISEDPTPCDKCALEWLQQEVESNDS